MRLMHDGDSRMTARRRSLQLDVACHLVAPYPPARPLSPGEQFQVRPRATPLDNGVLLFRLVAVLVTNYRVRPV